MRQSSISINRSRAKGFNWSLIRSPLLIVVIMIGAAAVLPGQSRPPKVCPFLEPSQQPLFLLQRQGASAA
jgi:hypothetical protein